MPRKNPSKTPRYPALARAIALAGGQSALAQRLGSTQSVIWTWANRDRRVRAEQVIPVAAAVDWQVTPHELRPDLYPHPSDGLPKPVDSAA